ncbi:MAB_1171c family putative transporter [Streptomyces sp. NPDC002588]|uniref:MAB_1171c family putative transporter n=1 Tax=Streptomyces sp. NPDC002588 TaxID=3154419 RepID=UPI003334A1A9
MNPEQLSYPVGATIGASALGYKLLHLRKDPHNPVLRSLCVTLGFASFAFLAAMPAIYVPVSNALGLDNLGKLIVHGSLIAFSICVQRMLLAWLYPPDVAKPKARLRVVIGAAVLLVMVVLLTLAPIDGNGTSENFAKDYATTPYVAEYLLVYVTAVGAGVAEIARLCWRFAKVAGRPWLVRGLRLTALGAVVNLGYSITRAMYVIGRNTGVHLDIAYDLAPVFATLGSVLVFIGLALPAMGPRLSAAHRWFTRLLAYHKLFPLWLALYEAVPDVALDPPARPRLARWRPGGLHYRVYRLVIEIRDARQELIQQLNPALITATATSSASSRKQLAAAEASVLRTALKARSSGHVRPAQSATAAPAPVGGSDLDEELLWFMDVAQAFAQSRSLSAP